MLSMWQTKMALTGGAFLIAAAAEAAVDAPSAAKEYTAVAAVIAIVVVFLRHNEKRDERAEKTNAAYIEAAKATSDAFLMAIDKSQADCRGQNDKAWERVGALTDSIDRINGKRPAG